MDLSNLGKTSKKDLNNSRKLAKMLLLLGITDEDIANFKDISKLKDEVKSLRSELIKKDNEIKSLQDKLTKFRNEVNAYLTNKSKINSGYLNQNVDSIMKKNGIIVEEYDPYGTNREENHNRV